mgnify:CR=1 FL=1
MRLRRWPLTAALAGAALITTLSASGSFAEQLVRAEARRAAPEAAPLLREASPAVNAVFLAYADNPALRLNARLSLRRYPAMSAEILATYGEQERFQRILRRYGPTVIPPIHYFLANEISTLELHQATGEAISRSRSLLERWWYGMNQAGASSAESSALGPVARGWYAVRFIRDNGHSFLGQFEVAADGQVIWIQTERVVEGVSRFFTSGVRSLEARLRTEGHADTADYLWAGIDVAAVIGVTKLLRTGRTAAKAARGTALSSRLSRAALTTRTFGRGVRRALRVGTWGVPVAIGYAVLRHPGLISSLSARAARWLSVPVWSVQLLVWTVILLPVFWVISALWRWLARPSGAVLIRTGRWLHRRRRVSAGAS